MANSFGTETPPSPGPDSSNALSSGSMGAGPSAMQPGAPAPGGAPQQAPAPTHAQTVAALRHFDAVRKELQVILADPSLGKSSIKSQIIDGFTRLVAQRFIKTTDAVSELAKVPQDPLQQMKWAKNMLMQARSAENAILDHYGATSPNLGTVSDHFAGSPPGTPDSHLDDMAALSSNYRQQSNG